MLFDTILTPIVLLAICVAVGAEAGDLLGWKLGTQLGYAMAQLLVMGFDDTRRFAQALFKVRHE